MERQAPTPTLLQDMHVHSTFSDGKNTIEENIEEAERLGLTQLTCVDHVRADTAYLPDYVAEIERLRPTTEIRLLCGIEAKLMDTSGALDLPAEIPAGVDRIYAADHQVPFADGPHHPRDVKEGLESGELDAGAVIDGIVDSTVGAVAGHDEVVIAHLFSILPKIGLSEDDVSDEQLERLAAGTVAGKGRIEISERWSCPNARSLQPFVDHGVEVLLSTDAHMRTKMGRYERCAQTLADLGIEPRGGGSAQTTV